MLLLGVLLLLIIARMMLHWFINTDSFGAPLDFSYRVSLEGDDCFLSYIRFLSS